VGAAVAFVEGVALIANGIAVAFVVLRDGVTGPSAVASPLGVTVEVLLYLVFGAALLWIGRGLLQGRGAALTPFALAQILGLAVSVPLAQGGGASRAVGWIATGLIIVGLAAWGVLLRRRLAVDASA
jgi:hypothetical protein